jgi:hypothetical protein
MEVLIATGLFAIVSLGIAQAVMLMHRYTGTNLRRMQAHLVAMSYFEQILGRIHPLQLPMQKSSEPLKEATLGLLFLDDPDSTRMIKLKYNTGSFVSPTDESEMDLNVCSVHAENDMPVKFKLEVRGHPLYDDNYGDDLTQINPPVGFQSIHLTYRWPSKVGEEESQWPTNQLYAIRPITPDDPYPET